MSDTGNLPKWCGADNVYKRLGIASRAIGAEEFRQWNKRKRKRSGDKFQPSDSLIGLIEAMNRGCEEELKAALWMHRKYWAVKTEG